MKRSCDSLDLLSCLSGGSPWSNMDQRPCHSPVVFHDTKDRLSDTAAHDQSKSSVCRATF